MPGTDLDLLIDAAREAGRIAQTFTGPSAAVWDKPDGAGPVTEADLAVNKMLEAELQAARPDYGWLSEETPDSEARQQAERVFIIDPIDGTRSFIEGSNSWAHSLAVAENGKVTAAAVYLPMQDKLYSASVGEGARLNDQPLAIGQRENLAGADVLVARPAMEPKNWRLPPTFNRHHRPSLAYRLSLVAEGKFDAMITLRRTWEWDIAAGELILREAGAATSDKFGQELVFNNPDPRRRGMIGANPSLHADILDALAT